MGQQTLNFKAYQIKNAKDLEEIEKNWRNAENSTELKPWARSNTSFREIVENIVPDKKGSWKSLLIYIVGTHKATTGVRTLCKKANDFLEKDNDNNLDILSVSAEMLSGQLQLKLLIRAYEKLPDIKGLFEYVGDDIVRVEQLEENISGNLIIPDEIKNHKYTDEQIKEHKEAYAEQLKDYEAANKEVPFLNRIDKYVPKQLKRPEDSIDLIYDLKTKDMKTSTLMRYEDFNKVFQEVMTYVNGIEYYHYVKVMVGDEKEEVFMKFLEDHIRLNYIDKHRFYEEDLSILLDKLYRSLFQLYIVQDLIDDPLVTDVKITAPDSIRARVHGKAYMSNITFIDTADYLRFVNGIAIRNRISQDTPSQTFTDKSDENYILRFSITAEYVNSTDWPYIHIRKVARKKPMADELIKAGMFDEKIRDYLLDCGKNSRGVVFAGPPGSGKTVCLNWFLEEAYEQSAEILVIQENDELFCYRKGVMFEHVVNYGNKSQKPVSLEQLGQLALVAGANVFVIGEAKGAEICSAITLSNSGCRTAITIHSPSATETVDKMADLAMRGYAQSYTEAKRMIKSFQTIVYLENFSIKEITEITGFNEKTHDMEYKYIYKKSDENHIEDITEKMI